MKTGKNILIVDDEESFRAHLMKLFVRRGFAVSDAATGAAALALAERRQFDVVLLDIVLPGLDGVEVLRIFRERAPETQVIMITGNATVSNAIASMKLGAYDYLTKPFDPEELFILVERACELSALRRDHQFLQRELERQRKFDDFIGGNDKTLAALALVAKVAPTDSTVLITGETGTGKELIAKAIHRQSLRHTKPFVVVNCSAIQETLLESELFGYEKGAFTGAVKNKSGLIEVANTGTIFLDEVGDLQPNLQIKLLRFLENGEFRPVGSTHSRRADVRVIAATNRDLKKMMQEGKFREDLFYRLNVINIQLPPLRERREDIAALVEYFLKKYCATMRKCVAGVEPEALAALQQYHWPGNVRELENVIERAVILAAGNTITLDDLPVDLIQPSAFSLPPANDKSLAAIEREHILKILAETAGNKTQAARILGITKKTLYAKLQQYALLQKG
ncbi:MAG: sigma-54 dependent transcriptional regulator [candidate division KSB1 bacterium]|nr:sigma-54 dependent transcriptional regulator [candidate division KSB1 bacterium]MDZ7276595.1 sigma-54 dependent transcriptional regulator [candidate division KSB1 bacterium]MDZ7288232.1 sigma-54 dependent transcriptional regulator [candidate division KSB1 bacterium]MDZ7300377.1 sigma-54 dependent transcriptional regulator [candidate division KSB1 bacterium]MDZ7307805.1 sigma-54 dependent transcriptional regulator [candidate division KSB1 bacterium]